MAERFFRVETVIGKDTADQVPVAIFRRIATQSNFVWAVSLDDSPVKLQVERDQGAIVGMMVGASGKSWQLNVDFNRGQVDIRQDIPGI